MSVHLFGKWPGFHGFTAKAKFMQRKLVFATFWGSFIKVHGTGQVRGSQATGHSWLPEIPYPRKGNAVLRFVAKHMEKMANYQVICRFPLPRVKATCNLQPAFLTAQLPLKVQNPTKGSKKTSSSFKSPLSHDFELKTVKGLMPFTV